jgi:DNA-binding XRE family transcriptional regulator
VVAAELRNTTFGSQNCQITKSASVPRIPEKLQSPLMALGRQIRMVREAKGFSQEEFAARVGLGRSYYGGIERGERNVAALNLMRIASTLGVEVGELFPAATAFRPLLTGSAVPNRDEE